MTRKRCTTPATLSFVIWGQSILRKTTFFRWLPLLPVMYLYLITNLNAQHDKSPRPCKLLCERPTHQCLELNVNVSMPTMLISRKHKWISIRMLFALQVFCQKTLITIEHIFSRDLTGITKFITNHREGNIKVFTKSIKQLLRHVTRGRVKGSWEPECLIPQKQRVYVQNIMADHPTVADIPQTKLLLWLKMLL